MDYAYCTIPTYPSGQIGFMLCSKNPVSRSGLAPGSGREPGRGLESRGSILSSGKGWHPDSGAGLVAAQGRE